VSAPAVPLVLAASALEAAAATLFPAARIVALGRDALRPPRPFEGPLFATLAALPEGTCVGLVVPVRLAAAASRSQPRPAATRSAGDGEATGLVVVEDHVNLELRGPLTGPWPAGAPRRFPSMTGRYQPAVVRSAAGPRVYSGGVVAGVGDLARPTPFERAALRRAACVAASDQLVPPAVVAAYYTHTLAACGVVQGQPIDEE